MTTDTKAVVRWDIGTDGLSDEVKALWHYKGRYVLFTDHERIVEEIGLLWARELVKRDDALAASRAETDGLKKDAERYRWLRMHCIWETTISDEIEKVIDEELESTNV